MPNISINKKDLDELGVSLKDILLAVTKSKQSGNDVITIKKKKSKLKKRTKPKRMNQFDNKKATFTRYPQSGGGGGGSIFNPTPQPIITTKVDLSQSDDKKIENQNKQQQEYIKMQIEDFKKDNENKIIAVNQNLSHLSDLNRFGMSVIYNKLNTLPNPLTNIQSSNFREPIVDKTDRFGIVPNNNFYDVATTNEGVVVEENVEPTPTATQEQITETQPVEETLPQQNDSFDVALEQEIKRRGRPKGSKNKPKNPLTQESISEEKEYNTRNLGQDLINQNFQTPDKFAKEQMKETTKQQDIASYFTPRRIVNKKPIPVIPEEIQLDEEEEFKTSASGIAPTPPTSEKPSKFKSRLPKPSNSRSRSYDSSLVYG